MKATIISIGDEILIGQITNTNATWMANRLTQEGFDVIEINTIGDDKQQIKDSIAHASSISDIILVTGGLGPTKDDITKKTLCEIYNTELVFSDAVLENIQTVISNRFPLNELTRQQALVPKDCEIIQNTSGTAPIMWFEKDDKTLISMPGVPYEMRNAMEQDVLPRLVAKFRKEKYLRTDLIVQGYTESALAGYLSDFEENLSSNYGLAYLPSPSLMKLRLFSKNGVSEEEFTKKSEMLKSILDDAVIATKDIPLPAILGEKLLEKKLTLSTAESCTGGNIARLIVSISGSSSYFRGSVVSYANDVKEDILGVSPSFIEKHGAVSEEVVLEMALGAQRLMKTDCSIAVSGVAGPAGGTLEKPVGTVWIATTYGDKCEAKCYQMGKLREINIERTSTIAMLQLLDMIK